jgi:hypothetical protein
MKKPQGWRASLALPFDKARRVEKKMIEHKAAAFDGG